MDGPDSHSSRPGGPGRLLFHADTHTYNRSDYAGAPGHDNHRPCKYTAAFSHRSCIIPSSAHNCTSIYHCSGIYRQDRIYAGSG